MSQPPPQPPQPQRPGAADEPPGPAAPAGSRAAGPGSSGRQHGSSTFLASGPSAAFKKTFNAAQLKKLAYPLAYPFHKLKQKTLGALLLRGGPLAPLAGWAPAPPPRCRTLPACLPACLPLARHSPLPAQRGAAGSAAHTPAHTLP
jgi:hypothetical protein